MLFLMDSKKRNIRIRAWSIKYCSFIKREYGVRCAYCNAQATAKVTVHGNDLDLLEKVMNFAAELLPAKDLSVIAIFLVD
ncbi:hypothetical protein QR680_015101 [Steinernema hermaphroditum]|uniref:Uncharacterized protein n=1 Tax=Steinernema hermaphroditum TaxID=289476 RepID=A0AA39IB74_9BILA|nr:hypothetical protein QR680_015101 [Steinernema hermaphroditum]